MAEAEDSKKPNGNAVLKYGEMKSSTSDGAEVKKESAGSISLKEAADVGAEKATEPAKRVINSDESSTAAPPTGEKDENDKSASERDFNRFPEKLLKILDSGEYEDIFSWSQSGNSFVIHKPYDLISHVLTKHFDAKEDMKFDSFLRKLYRWGFSKKTADDQEGDEEGAHIYFHSRGNFDLCAKVTCTSKPATSRPSAHQKNDMNFMPYARAGAGIPPQISMFPGAAGILPPLAGINGAQQSYQASLIGRGLNGQSHHELGSLQNMSALHHLPGSIGGAMGGRAEFFLKERQRQELRERELMLLQHQQLYNANAGISKHVGIDGIPSLHQPFADQQQQQYPGAGVGIMVPPSNLNPPNNVLEAMRLGQDINRFERDILRFQQENAILTGQQTNGAASALSMSGGLGQDHRRRMSGGAHASMGLDVLSPSSRVDQMLAAEQQRQAFADRAAILPLRSTMTGSIGGHSSLSAQHAHSRIIAGVRPTSLSATGGVGDDLLSRQRRMILSSQGELQQNGHINNFRTAGLPSSGMRGNKRGIDDALEDPSTAPPLPESASGKSEEKLVLPDSKRANINRE